MQPSQKPFSFKIGNPEHIYKQFVKEGSLYRPLTLGSSSLHDPLEKLEVKMTGDSKAYHLKASLRVKGISPSKLAKFFLVTESRRAVFPIATISSCYDTIVYPKKYETTPVVILDPEKRTPEFVIAYTYLLDHTTVEIMFGEGYDSKFQYTPKKTLEGPKQLATQIGRYMTVVETVINGYYNENKLNPAPLVFFVQSTSPIPSGNGLDNIFESLENLEGKLDQMDAEDNQAKQDAAQDAALLTDVYDKILDLQESVKDLADRVSKIEQDKKSQEQESDTKKDSKADLRKDDLDVPDVELYFLPIKKPGVSFDDIGGNKDAKEELEKIGFSFEHSDAYKKWAATPAKGVLLHGPQGTGKTLLAKAVATQVDADFYVVSTADIFRSLLGQSEQQMQLLFETVRDNERRSILFFDEIDALTRVRHSDDHTSERRVLNLLMSQLDGINSTSGLMIIGATNRIDDVDPALKRSGRMDKLIYVGLPDKSEREQILKIHHDAARKRAQRELFDAIDYGSLASQTDGLSGADLEELTRRTLEQKARDEVQRKSSVALVTTRDILLQIRKYEHGEDKRVMGFTTESRAQENVVRG